MNKNKDSAMDIENEMTEWLKDPNNKHLGARKSAIKFAEYYHNKALALFSVVGRSEQLKAVEELVDFARDVTNVCDLDRLEEILDRL